MPVEIDLLAIERGTVTAPAGCGKTHLIGDALGRHAGPKPILVLTHTNAGVAALRTKLERISVPSRRYRLSTIDGWAIRLVKTFPNRSGISAETLELRNRTTDYPAIRDSAWRLLQDGHVNDILAATYDRLIVDEYQDCSIRQHTIVHCAAMTLRTCVLGDPMQAIFGFGADRLADWDEHVCQHFPIIAQLKIPQRWVQVGEEAFGQWLLRAREHFKQGRGLDLTAVPSNVSWVQLAGDERDHEILRRAGSTSARANEKTLIIAETWPKAQREIAKLIPGAVTVENVDLTDLIKFSDGFDLNSPGALGHLIEFAGSVMTNVGTAHMLARVDSLRRGRARRGASDAENAAIDFGDNPSYAAAASLLGTIAAQGGVHDYRPAILRGAYNMLNACSVSPTMTPAEAATIVREQSRLVGRPLAKRTVGSTLLLKGLEAEICIILSPEKMDRRHLYVAMTRGSKRLIICSRQKHLRPM